MSPTLNQIAIVLNFALSVGLRFTRPDPVLMTRDRDKHHCYVLDPKKTNITFVNGDANVIPKVIDNGTFKVQPKTN